MRDAGRSGALDDVTDVLRAGVAPAAHLETEGKVGRHPWPPDDVSVLPDDRFRLGPEEHDELEHAADDAEG